MIVLGVPKKDLQIKSLGASAHLLDHPIGNIVLLGNDEKVKWSQAADALTVKLPGKMPNDQAIVFKITL